MYDNYVPANLSTDKQFDVDHIRKKLSLCIPSQGTDGTLILRTEGEMAYEQRQMCLAMDDELGIFVTRKEVPAAEMNYWHKLWPQSSVKYHHLKFQTSFDSLPLDQILLKDSNNWELFKSCVEASLAKYNGARELSLSGFNETPYMEQIADKLGIRYYGNSSFAEWAGTKSGLKDFTDESQVLTPHSYKIAPGLSDLEEKISILKVIGYPEVVLKVDHSTGGMGHRRIKIDRALVFAKAKTFKKILPTEYLPSEGGVIQGWIPDAVSLSIAIFVDFDGSVIFTNAQMHELQRGNSFKAVGSFPLDQKLVEVVKSVGTKVGKVYVKHKAYGPHTLGMILPSHYWAETLGFPPGHVLVNDENSRPGASTIAANWIINLRAGYYGKGWKYSKIKVRDGLNFGNVLAILDKEGLLINSVGANTHGVFVFGADLLDSGYEQSVFIIAISKQDSFEEASCLLRKSARLIA